MTTPNIDVDEGEFREILESVRRLSKRVRRVVNDLIDNVNNVISLMPDYLADRLIAILNRIGKMVGEFFQEVGEFFTQPGWPPALLSATIAWTTEVGGRASAWSPRRPWTRHGPTTTGRGGRPMPTATPYPGRKTRSPPSRPPPMRSATR